MESTDPDNFTMFTVNHVTKEIIHIIHVSNLQAQLAPVQEEEATMYICIVCSE